MQVIKQHGNLNEKCAVIVLLIEEKEEGDFVWLAPKKQAVHVQKEALFGSLTLNGYGGKWQEGDHTILATAVRELQEESGVKVDPKQLKQIAYIHAFWPGNTTDASNMELFFFVCKHDVGWSPTETNEMGKPELFPVNSVPYERMLPGDRMILSHALRGKDVSGKVYFKKNDKQMVVDEEKTLLNIFP